LTLGAATSAFKSLSGRWIGLTRAVRIRVGDPLTISRAGQQLATTRVTGVEMFRKKAEEAPAGGNVGLLLDGITRARSAAARS
jgi:translation elongation factor EF-Tu-like GTPase